MKRHDPPDGASVSQNKKKGKLEPRPDLSFLLHDIFPHILGFLDPRKDTRALARCMSVSPLLNSLAGPQLYHHVRVADEDRDAMTTEHFQFLLRRHASALRVAPHSPCPPTRSPLFHLRHLTVHSRGNVTGADDIARWMSIRSKINLPGTPHLKSVIVNMMGGVDTWATAFATNLIPYDVDRLVLRLALESQEWSPGPEWADWVSVPRRIRSSIEELVLVAGYFESINAVFDCDPERETAHVENLTVLKVVLTPPEEAYGPAYWTDRKATTMQQLHAIIQWARKAVGVGGLPPLITIVGAAEIMDYFCMQSNWDSSSPGLAQYQRHDFGETRSVLEGWAEEDLEVRWKGRTQGPATKAVLVFQPYEEYLKTDKGNLETTKEEKDAMREPARRWSEYMKKKE